MKLLLLLILAQTINLIVFVWLNREIALRFTLCPSYPKIRP